MSNLRTTTDLLQTALFNAGEPQNSSSEFYTQAVIYINRIYQELCSGGSMLDPTISEQWWWLRKSTPGVLTLLPGIVAPTVTLTKGSTLLTYSTPPLDPVTGLAISVAGFMFQAQGTNGDVYRILSHTSGDTTATLDQIWTQSDVTAGAQRTMKFQYPLATDVKSIVGRMRAFQNNRYDIDYADIDPMRVKFPLSTLPSGVPTLFAMVQDQTCEFSHYVGDDASSACRVEYDYIFIPDDLVDDAGATSPLVPFQYRSILSDETAAMILADKSDSTGVAYEAGAKARLQAMAKEHRRRQVQSSNLTGKITPRMGDVTREDSPLRSESGFIFG